MAKLCQRGITAAKAKYEKWPSAYASGYAVQVCKESQPDASGKKAKSFKKGGLAKWFGENWVDVSRKVDGKHPPCGRSDASKGAYPACRPARAAAKMTPAEKRSVAQRKRATNPAAGRKPTRVAYPVSPSGRRKKS